MSRIVVMASAAFKEAYLTLLPDFERTSGHRVASSWVPSVEIMRRLADLVILSAQAIDRLMNEGIVSERFDLARCGIAVAVRSGAQQPDISTADALRQAVLSAHKIVYSTGPSGLYLAALFRRMGIDTQIASRVIVVQGEPAGAVVARGEAEIGFQQMSELLPVAGIDIVGPLPPEVREITTFSAGLHARAPEPQAARALIDHFRAPSSSPVIRSKGMEPA